MTESDRGAFEAEREARVDRLLASLSGRPVLMHALAQGRPDPRTHVVLVAEEGDPVMTPLADIPGLLSQLGTLTPVLGEVLADIPKGPDYGAAYPVLLFIGDSLAGGSVCLAWMQLRVLQPGGQA